MKYSTTIVVLCALVSCGCNQTTVESAVPVLAELPSIQLSEQLASLVGPSLDSFARLIDDASIVAIGESRHDTKEQFEAKALLSRTLISDFGFRVVIFEESFTHALALDAYVTTGQGDIQSILNDLAGWYLWDTEEMVVFIDWIRQFNEAVPRDEMVRVFGMDITAPALGISHAAKAADKLDPSRGWVELDYGLGLHVGDYWPETLERYSQLPGDRVEEIAGNLEELRATLAVRATSSDSSVEERLAAIEAEIGKRAHDMFSSDGIADVGAVRERGMAHAVERITEHVGGTLRTIVWTHNLHAAKSSFRMPQMVDGDLIPMGVLLKRMYGGNYLAIGGTFGEGAFPQYLPPGERTFARPSIDTVDGAFAQLGHSATLLNLVGIAESSPALKWLSEDREWRMQDTVAVLSPAKSFDAIYFVDQVSRAQPTPLALQKFRE